MRKLSFFLCFVFGCVCATAVYAQDDTSSARLNVFVNGQLEKTYLPVSSGGNEEEEPLDLTMGDKVKFELADVPPGSPTKPSIKGMPYVWIARSAGEVLYYCTPSVVPGGYRPWLGFDSNVHGTAIRKYPNGFEKVFPDWTVKHYPVPDKIGYQWEWTLQRRMDADKTHYEPSYSWNPIKILPESKALKLPDGTTTVEQRNNQKDGLNMELLRKWGDLSGAYYNIDSYEGPDYMLMGTDPDEILYLDTKYGQKKRGKGLVVLEGEPWKYILPEEEGVSVIDAMVTAYMRNREKTENRLPGVLGTQGSKTLYKGYEIQDMGTSVDYPNGTGDGNNEAPGLVKISTAGMNFEVKMNVKSPFSEDKGFYSMIEGASWPAIQEKGVDYTLKGLKGLSISELDKYSLELSSQGTNGAAPDKTTFYIKDLSEDAKQIIQETGKWTAKFDFKSFGYYDIAAYYQRSEDSERVLIAGKELLDVQLRFVSVPGAKENLPGVDLKEGRGDGAYIYLEEYRNTKKGDFDTPRYDDKYVKSLVRTYTFNKGDEVTFQTHDSDPHTFIHTGTEFYLSERMQAKRIPNDSLNVSLAYYIDEFDESTGEFVSSVTPSGYGKNFTHKWDDVGTYRLRVVYRGPDLTNANYVFHKVVIRDSNQLGEVVTRDLHEYEKKWLGLTKDHSQWKIAEVKNILSKYMYVDGPRTGNRFGRYNDFSRSFTWETASVGDAEFAPNYSPSIVKDWVDSFSFDWPPKDWVRHYNGSMPSDVDKSWIKPLSDVDIRSYVSSMFDQSVETWQRRLPWISTTEYDGPRIRTNIKVVYSMRSFFDNNTGAFSGNPTIPSRQQLNDVIMGLLTDEDKDKLDFYLKLKHGEIILVDEDKKYFRVFNTDLAGENPKLIYSDKLPAPVAITNGGDDTPLFSPVEGDHLVAKIVGPIAGGLTIIGVLGIIYKFGRNIKGAIYNRVARSGYSRLRKSESLEMCNR